MIAFDNGTLQLAHGGNALLGKGVVADDIAHANEMGAHMRLGIVEHRLQRMMVGMDIAKDCEAHGK
jgi:hypothetical protein